jgi:hypothetical protein
MLVDHPFHVRVMPIVEIVSWHYPKHFQSLGRYVAVMYPWWLKTTWFKHYLHIYVISLWHSHVLYSQSLVMQADDLMTCMLHCQKPTFCHHEHTQRMPTHKHYHCYSSARTWSDCKSAFWHLCLFIMLNATVKFRYWISICLGRTQLLPPSHQMLHLTLQIHLSTVKLLTIPQPNRRPNPIARLCVNRARSSWKFEGMVGING